MGLGKASAARATATSPVEADSLKTPPTTPRTSMRTMRTSPRSYGIGTR